MTLSTKRPLIGAGGAGGQFSPLAAAVKLTLAASGDDEFNTTFLTDILFSNLVCHFVVFSLGYIACGYATMFLPQLFL